VLWLRRLVAGLSQRGAEFDPRHVHMRFVVDQVDWDRFFPENFQKHSIPIHSFSPTLYNSLTESVVKNNIQDRQCTYNVTLRRVLATILAVEKQYYIF
jgi:hypothetical protein